MRRATRILTASILACSMLLTGCKGKETKKESVYETKIDKDAVYRLKDFSFEQELKGEVRDMQVGGDKLYISTAEWEEIPIEEASVSDASSADTSDQEQQIQHTEMSNVEAVSFSDAGADTEYIYKDTYYLYSANLDGSNVKLLSEAVNSSEVEESTYLSRMCVDEAGNFYGYYSCYNTNSDTNKYYIQKIDVDGNESEQISVDDLFDSEEDYVSNMLMGGDGNIYLIGDSKVYILDKDGKKKASNKLENWIMASTVNSQGEVLVCYCNKDGKDVFSAIDEQGKLKGKETEMHSSNYGSDTMIPSHREGYTFFMNDGNSLCGMDADGNLVKIVNWLSSNIVSQNVYDICDTGENGFLVLYSDTDESGNMFEKVYLLEKVNPEDVVEKTTITYGCIWGDENIRAQAIAFNKSQDQYQISIKDYSEYDEPYKQFNADLLAGDVPDIIDLSNVDFDRYVQKGMLEDLYPYLEKDPDLNKEDFQENLMSILETDGKLYRISNSGGINAFAMRKSDLNGKNAISLEEFMALDAERGDEVTGFYSLPREGVLSNLCAYNADYYVNWEEGTCNFDSEQFVKLLEYAKTYPKSEDMDYEESESLPTQIQNKKVLGTDCYGMTMEELVVYDKMFDGDVAFIGEPSDGNSGLAISFWNSFGISSKSQNKDGAWAFIRTMLTREYYAKNSMYYSAIPLRKDCFEDMVKRETATEKYTDDFGNEVYPVNGSYGYEDYEVTVEPLTKEQVEVFRDMVSRVDRENKYYEEILDIIYEEAAPFFDGQKSAEEVADIIQNRVSTYINENR